MGVGVNLGSIVTRTRAVSCGVVLLLCGTGTPASADTVEDARLVFCLSRPQREGLADAAVALGLVRPGGAAGRMVVEGTELDAPDWRVRRPADFDRACRALHDSLRPPGPSLFSTVFPLLTAVVGAIIGFGATSWRDRVTRGRALADDLRTAMRRFERATTAYITSWIATRSAEPVLDRRGELLAQLARAKAAHRPWTELGALEQRLADGPLGTGLTTGWTGRDDGLRRKRLTAELALVRDSAYRVAHALEQPTRRHRALRTGTLPPASPEDRS